MTQSPSLPAARAPQLLVNSSSTLQSLHISISLTFRGACCTVRRSHGNLLVTQSSSSSQNGQPSSSSPREGTAVVHQSCQHPGQKTTVWPAAPSLNSLSPRAASGGCGWRILTYSHPSVSMGIGSRTSVDTKICRAQVPYIKGCCAVRPLYPGYHIHGSNPSDL